MQLPVNEPETSWWGDPLGLSHYSHSPTHAPFLDALCVPLLLLVRVSQVHLSLPSQFNGLTEQSVRCVSNSLSIALPSRPVCWDIPGHSSAASNNVFDTSRSPAQLWSLQQPCTFICSQSTGHACEEVPPAAMTEFGALQELDQQLPPQLLELVLQLLLRLLAMEVINPCHYLLANRVLPRPRSHRCMLVVRGQVLLRCWLDLLP